MRRSRRTSRTRATLAGGSALLALLGGVALPTTAAAVQDAPTDAGPPAGPSGTYDVRDEEGPTLPTEERRDAVADLVRRSGAGTRVTWDPRFGTPRSIRRDGGYLTGPWPGSAAEVARDWLALHRAAFGLSATDVETLAVRRDHTLPGTGTHVVTWQQTFGGVESAHGGRLTVSVTEDGKVLSYAGSPRPGATVGDGFALSTAGAVDRVVSVLATDVDYTPSRSGTRAGWTTYDKGPFAAGSYARRVTFPTADDVRPAYRVLFVEKADEAYDVVIDAQTGAVLFRDSLVDHESEGTVYENFPGAAKGGRPVVASFGPTDESPSGWVDPSGLAGLPGPTTFGNNANTYANYSNFIAPADQAPRPVSATSQFHYTYTNEWGRTEGETVPPSYAQDLDPAATNLFYHHNRIHDELYDLGFTESGGNFQVNNSGSGGNDGDPVLGLVHAGAASGGAPTYTGRDNAYMLTLPDGIASWSGMFLWEPIDDAFEGPYADGNFDSGVIEHEYAHGLTNRYVSGGEALGSHQSGSMGEGWGDWYALNYQHREGLTDESVVGEYVTGNGERGIRNWAYDDNPTGFGDIGYDVTGPEVHADGEIWTSILWDLRKALVAEYGQATGSEVTARIVTDAMPLSAPDPSFLDMRDAILTADTDRYHGDHHDTIWTAFARRGAGAGATTATGDDTDPQPAFDHLFGNRNGTLVGEVVNASTGEPVADARVIVGEYEARVSPLRRTSSSGGFSAPMVAGTYPVTVQAPGFGAQTFEGVEVTAGETKALTLELAPNLASSANGAEVVAASSERAALPAKNLIDDTEASVWSTEEGPGAYDDGPDRYVTVRLAEPAEISTVQVSAFKHTGSSRFAAVEDWTLQVSQDGQEWATVESDAFSYAEPRPMAPDLHYRTFPLESPTQAAYVRFFADSVMGDTTTYAQAAEVQVFADQVSGVAPLPVEPEDPVTDSGTIAAGNPATGETLDPVVGVTGTEFTSSCAFPPASQGADGWVTQMPEAFGDGTHAVTVTGEESPAGHDLDLYFYDAECGFVRSQATAAADESTTIPGGTSYVVTQLWTGVDVPFTLEATPAQ